MKFGKLLAGLVIVSAAGAAVVGKISKDKKKQEELDDYLMPNYRSDEECDPSKDLKGGFRELQSDLISWNENTDPESIVLSFQFNNESDMSIFEESVKSFVKKSLSNVADCMLEITFGSNQSEEDFADFVHQLEHLFSNVPVTYLGYYLAKS